MISANTSSRSISKSPTSFIWKQSGDVLRARAQVPSRACCGQKKASENQQKQPRRSQMLASVAHQCLQRIRSPQNAALEICAKCLQFANAAFFCQQDSKEKSSQKKKIPPSFEQDAVCSILLSKRGNFQKMVIPARFERATFCLGELVSYFLSISSRSIFCHFTLICQEILRVFLNDRPV